MSEPQLATADGKRERQEEGEQPDAKRIRESTSASEPAVLANLTRLPSDVPPAVSRLGLKPQLPEMPPSLELVTGVKTDLSARLGFVGETEVGIIGYIGDPHFAGVQGVIKQRFTDFLVNEITMDGEILHLVGIDKPAEPEAGNQEEAQSVDAAPQRVEPQPDATSSDLPENLQFEVRSDWPASHTSALRPHFSDETIIALYALLEDGRHPRRPQDSGWGSRPQDSGWGSRQVHQEHKVDEEELAMNLGDSQSAPSQGRNRGRGRGRGRGGQRGDSRPVDTREVLTQVIASKEERAAAHQIIRELFKGIFDTAAREDDAGQHLVITWSGKGGPQQRKARGPRQPPYIHFTLHKTNRETQDCLGHISRMIGCHIRDLSVCGTKDKRAITVQRVCLKRNGMTLQSVWKAANGIKVGRRTEESAVEERGERGTRIGDLAYSHQQLDLGMLKGNHFTITLRNVHSAGRDAVDAAMATIRDRGFINFFGMQRFGTSTVPTHVTGLLILQQQWAKALDSILSLREGEHPDCVKARLAWLEDKDFNKALELMPRRSVAERSIWEHWKKGNRPEDKLGALGSIPRNLRTMYVHAYQSYIWNVVTSERIKMCNTSAIAGDLVFAESSPDDDLKETSASREVKQLTEADASNYALTDVVLPLPGWHVDYPGGAIGKLYESVLAADGLDPTRMRRDQREYSLPGSYRKIVQMPKNVSWEHIRYTDPDLPLAQSDEDKLLGLNEPVLDDPAGKFEALCISWTLGTASYATMALREITRQETATWAQIGLTAGNEDQAHKGNGEDNGEVDKE